MKRILSLFLCLVLLLGISMQAYATGDPNIDGGGGGMGEGTNSNYWNPGMDGVRVTIVEADSHAVASASVDLTNKTPSSNIIDFGKVCKISYNGGSGLAPQVNSYSYRSPAQSLPRIISSGSAGASIEAIRSYFTDAQVLQSLCGYIGFDYEMLIGGEYKLLVEPLAYFCYSGLQYAMTATEAALYDQQVNGGLRSWMGSLTHKNLPLAIFLQTPDLGYPAWSGSKTQKVSNADILSSLGIGIVRFTELPEPPEISTFDYEYRTDTDVITSVEVSGGQADPDNPVSVQFSIQGRTYTVDNVFYPDGDSQLAWVKWHTPDEPCVVTIYVSVTGSGTAQSVITANVISLEGKDPPNPLADDRNDSFTQTPVPEQPEVTNASWGIWSPWWQEFWEWVPDWDKCWHSDWVSEGCDSSCPDDCSGGHGYWDDWYHWVDNGWWEDHGWWEFDYEGYSASLTATMSIAPDDKSPTATASTLKSGYGIQQSVSARVNTDQSAAVTAAQNAVTYFPEFSYQTYWRLLDPTVTGKRSSFEFRENRYSTYNRRTHFTPIWYPDGAYTPYTYVLDCWTPVGMLSLNMTDSVTIRGNLWEEWHIAPSSP